MDELKKLTDQLEYIFLKKIIEGLKNNSITIAQSKTLAVEFLAMEPVLSIDDAKQKINAFVNSHSMFDKLKTYTDSYHEEKRINGVIERMRKYIKEESDVDKALQVAKME